MDLRSAALLLSVSLLPTLSAAAELPVQTAVDEVTVHPDSARVTRRGQVQVPSGEVRLVIEGVTPQLLDDSLQVATSGGARARILGVSVETQRRVETSSPELQSAEALVRKLEDRDRSFANGIDAANKRREFLDSVRSTYVRERTENLGVRATDTRELGAMVDFVGKQTLAVLEEIRETEVKRREVGRELEAARAEVARVKSTGSRVDKIVRVDLYVEREGALGLDLTYFAYNASWRPVWDARLDPDKGRVELGLQASIEQRTGEDWSGVRLAVSTARPERRIQVPELEPRYLQKAHVYSSRGGASAKSMSAPMSAGAVAELADSAPAPEVQIDVGLLATTFSAPTRVTVPSTGEPRKSMLASFPLDAKLVRRAVPSVEALAFLVAETTNSTGVPLLAGPIELFVGSSFIGRTAIDDVPAGDELKLAFGPDPRVRIERKVLNRSREESGVFSKRETLRYRIRTTVKNLYKTPVEVSLLDQLPVSRDEDIEVKVLEGITKATGADDMKPGVKTWKLELAPGEERVVELRYEVSYPRGQTVSGLP